MSRLNCARYVIPLHRPWWERAWRAMKLWALRDALTTLQSERDGYLEVAAMPGSKLKVGEQYLANCAEQEKQLRGRISLLEIHS